jgi:hypothetical protein
LVLELEHLEIETRLISERFANAMGECEKKYFLPSHPKSF